MFSFANAQKGTVLVQGNMNYSSQKRDKDWGESKTNNFGFSPKVGYQFSDNWTVGVEGSFSNSKTENSSSNYETTQLATGAFIRYSHKLSDLFSIYSDLGVGFQSAKRLQDNNNVNILDEKADGFYTSITPSVLMNIGKGFGLNFNFGGVRFDSYNNPNVGGYNRNFNFNLGSTFSVGISKNF